MLEPSSCTSHPTPSSASSTPQTPASDIIDLRGSSGDSPGKSTWKERNNGDKGTIIKSGDIGDGLVSSSYSHPH